MDAAALLDRARALRGHRVEAIARALALPIPGGGVGTKGRVGTLIERALGATGASGAAVVDFPSLGIELKTIPVDERGRPHESTFVCAVRLDDEVDWEASWVRRKLARVLFVPIVGSRRLPLPERTVGEPVLWTPTAEQLDVLRADYDDIMGLVGVGRIEDVSAHLGRWLQLRPKAADGTPRAVALGADGERIPTVARGFYLRARFTEALLADPTAAP